MNNNFAQFRQKNLAVLKRPQQKLGVKQKRQRKRQPKKQPKRQHKRQSRKQNKRHPQQAKMRALIKRLGLEHLK